MRYTIPEILHIFFIEMLLTSKKNPNKKVYGKKLLLHKQKMVQEFYYAWKKMDTTKAYNNLVKNLDSNSKNIVDNILHNIELVAKDYKALKHIYSPEEKKQLESIFKDYRKNKKKLGNNKYAYKKYLLPINHFEENVFYYQNCLIYLSKKSLNTIRKKDILDVGGYIGDSAIVFEDYTDKTIHTFEPEIHNYNYLLKTLEMNNTTKVKPYNFGLGSKDAELDLVYLGSSSKIVSNHTDNKYNTEKIKITSLDDFIAKNPINIGLIKVDIEGAESDFIKGAEKTIKTQKPVILLSIYHNAYDFFELKRIIENWNLGYKFKIVRPIIPWLFYTETMLIAEPA
ncbi:MAG: FkbM family methyltransferase [Alphaproteobacteria bacterium]|nr:FkbM family methyltransferase [Alphaproteobacteria bacterium]